MKHIAAYALLVLSGKEESSAANIEKVLKDSGAKPDSEKAKLLAEALKGKKFHEIVKAGQEKLGSMAMAVSAGGAAAAPAAGGATAAAAPKEEEKVEEEAADVDMGGLFGDDDY